MRRHLTPRALQRAQWFSDLSTALREAERLLLLLESHGGFPIETVRLRLRVEAVRSELDVLNRVMLPEGRIVGPSWPALPPAQVAER